VADPALRRLLRQGVVPPPGRDRFTLYGRNGRVLREGGEPSRGHFPFLEKHILIDAGVFFQSNGILLEQLIRELRALAAGADPSLPMADLYCGTGVFAAFLGDRFAGADLVELNKTALDLARQNVSAQGARFFAQSDEEWAAAAGEGGPYGFVVADPPRQGLSRGMRRYLIRRGPSLFAYVSCDPAVLARDSRELLGGGYALEKLLLYDFYPQTAHIESLALFARRKNP
jgi:23S rRNA (uracil1939-C5)-methyltransferase